MLAAAGFLVQEGFHPLFSADGGPAIEQIPALPPAIWFLMTLGIGICETLRIQKGWENPYSGDGQENIQKLKADYYPGDLGFDPLGLKPTDPAELREMQEKELSHGAAPAPPLLPALPPPPTPRGEAAAARAAAGLTPPRTPAAGRLGMLAAAGFMAQEAVSGKTWSQQDVNFEGLLLGGYFSQEAAEVARDAAASAL